MIFFFFFLVVFVLSVTVWIVYFGLQSKKLSKRTKDFVGDTKNPRIKILMVGDSVMRGVGTSSSAHSLQALVAQHSTTSQIIMCVKDGSRCGEVLRVLQEKEDSVYDQVILFCGGMDIIYFSRKRDIKKNLEELFKHATSMSKNVVYISPPNVGDAPLFPFPVSSIYSYRSKKFFDISRECAATYGVTFVDYYSKGNTHYVEDNSHPNDHGYRNLFDLFKDHVIR